MSIVDKIITEEGRFFDKFLARPTLLILTPEGLAALQEEITGEDDYAAMFELTRYEGMVIAVTTDATFPEFKLAVGE